MTGHKPKSVAHYNDFTKLDIRVGKILTAEEFPEARKPAYKLNIDFGPEIGIKQSSAQLPAHYKADELIGKMILGVVNFAPKQIGPFVSECLTLGVPGVDGECWLINPEQSAVDAGQIQQGGRLY